MLLNNQWVIKDIQGEIKKYLVTKEYRNSTYQTLQNAAKLVLRGKYTADRLASRNKTIAPCSLTFHQRK